jgi:pyrroline-5-carboxylate reductase
MLEDKTIAFIGSGNMGEALVAGLIESKTAQPDAITCTDIRQEKLDEIHDRYGVAVTTDNLEAIAGADIVIYAVKPQIIASVLRNTSEKLDMTKLVISIAAGVPLAAIEACLDKKLRLIRVMPNLPVSVKMGASGIAAGDNILDGDVALAKTIFDSVGIAVFLGENYLLDAVTGLSGSGPAYIFLIVDALADAGVKVGLSRKDALSLATQTVAGAARMLEVTGMHPSELKDRVTSPGGTAIAGLHTLEQGGIRTTLINAVEAATQRSRELGELFTKNNGGT